jgi:hypothetical protein
MSVQHRMGKWWNKWTYEIPLAIGDVLWDALVVRFAAFLDRLTIRKVIEFVVIAVLVMAFVQTLPIDLAILFAGDTLMYLELLIAIRLAAGREFVVAVLRLTLRLAHFAIRLSRTLTVHSMARLNGWREKRRPARLVKSRRAADNSEDDREIGSAWGTLAMA